MRVERLTIDGFDVEVRRSSRRRSMELIVDRTGDVVAAVPAGAGTATVERLVHGSREWLRGKLERKAALRTPLPSKQYVSGEGFLYLGRSHRLLLVATQTRPLALHAGRFCLLRSEVGSGHDHFVRWYTEHGQRWLASRVAGLAPRLRRQPSGVKVRDLGSRWASCGQNGMLYFHWAAMTLPPGVIDYLALHELLHLEIPNHGREFWRRLETLLPNARSRSQWLAEHGAAGVL